MKDKNITDSFYLQIQREITRIERKSDIYTWLFYFIRLIQIAFAGAITVLSGLTNKNSDNNTIIIILYLGAITTAVTAIDTLFQIDAKRNTYKLVLFEFRTIRAEFVYKHIQKTIDTKFMEDLFEKYKRANSYARDLIGSDSERETSDEKN